MSTFIVNGRPARSVDPGDRGFMYGDGVFRTILVRGGRALNWARHFRLFEHDCGRIGLACPSEFRLREEIGRVAPGEAIVKIIVTRGASGRGYAFDEAVEPTRVVAAYPAPETAGRTGETGVRVRRCDLRLATQPRLAGVKSLNRLENVLARAEWRDPEIAEGLLADGEGRLIEATSSNVFLATGGRLITPDLSRCGVNGTQRERVLDLARGNSIACEVRDVDLAELGAADEVFLTNSIIGVRPVTAFDEVRWAPGPVARRLQALIEEEDARAA